jgi:hypothetical protein
VLTGRQRFPRHLVPELYVTNTFSTFEAIRNADFHTEFILEYGILQSAKCRQQSLLSTWLVFCYLPLAALSLTLPSQRILRCFALLLPTVPKRQTSTTIHCITGGIYVHRHGTKPSFFGQPLLLAYHFLLKEGFAERRTAWTT